MTDSEQTDARLDRIMADIEAARMDRETEHAARSECERREREGVNGTPGDLVRLIGGEVRQ